MKRTQSWLSVTLLALILTACQAVDSTAGERKPQPVYRIVYEIQPNDWYKEQAQLWKSEIDKNPASEEAWYNYYNANRYAHFEDINNAQKQEKLKQIVDKMEQAIPETYTYYMLKCRTDCDAGDISLVRKAHQLQPENPEPYYSFISHYAISGDMKGFNTYCQKLYDSHDLMPWLLNYNYNMLMSLEENAILITNGDNDTYPAWVLQQAKHVRPDVLILNLSMLSNKDYFQNQLVKRGYKLDYNTLHARAMQAVPEEHKLAAELMRQTVTGLNRIKPEIPLYFAVTVYPDYVEAFKNDMYLVGLAYRYSTKRLDNLAILKRNLEKGLNLDYLTFEPYELDYRGQNLKAQMNLNYIAPIMMLAGHYKLSGQLTEAKRWHALALKLAAETGDGNLLRQIEEKANRL